MAKLNVEVGVNNTAFRQGLDAMRSQAKSWGKDVAGMLGGAFAVGAIVSWTQRFMEMTGRIEDLSQRLGESTDTIQRVGEAAEIAGADIEMVVKAMSKLTISAAEGSDKFAKFGVSAEAFANASLEDKILMLSAAYEQANGDTEKMIALMDLLGSKGQDLIPLISQGPAQLSEVFGEASIVSENAIKNINKMDDALKKMGKTMQALAGEGFDFLDRAITGIAMRFGGMSDAQMKAINDRMAKDMGMEDPKEWSKPKKSAQVQDPEEVKKQAKEAEDLAKRAEQIGERELKRQMDKMTVSQRILTLEQIRAALLQRSADSATTEAERVTIAEKVLSLEEQITAEKKAQAAEQAKTANAALSLAERVMKRNLDAMDPEKRIETLEGMKKALQDAAVNPALSDEQRIDAANRLLDIEDQIAQAKEDKANADEKAKKEAEDAAKKDEKSGKETNVISSSLQSVGGGGGAYVAMSSEARELQNQTNILRQIAANTSPQTQRIGGKQPSDAF